MVDFLIGHCLNGLLANLDKWLTGVKLEHLLELVDRLLKRVDGVILELFGFTNSGQDASVALEVLQELLLETQNVLQWNLIELAGGSSPDLNGLVLNWVWRELRLL